MTTQTIALYGGNLFGSNDHDLNQRQLGKIVNSGFTKVILFTLHVKSNGDLTYNDSPIVQNGTFSPAYTYLAALLQQLKTGGTVKQVVFAIGSAGDNFATVQQLFSTPAGTATLRQNFNVLIQALPIDGFDFDPEPITDDITGTVAQLTLLLNSINGMSITWCPFSSADLWIQTLAQVYQQNNQQQAVSGFNLQCYAGGAGNDPVDWINQIKNSSSPLGINDAAAFLVPGFWSLNVITKCQPNDGMGVKCPCNLQATFAGLKQRAPGLTSGFIWQAAQIFTCENSSNCDGEAITPTSYAQAIISGLGN